METTEEQSHKCSVQFCRLAGENSDLFVLPVALSCMVLNVDQDKLYKPCQGFHTGSFSTALSPLVPKAVSLVMPIWAGTAALDSREGIFKEIM